MFCHRIFYGAEPVLTTNDLKWMGFIKILYILRNNVAKGPPFLGILLHFLECWMILVNFSIRSILGLNFWV